MIRRFLTQALINAKAEQGGLTITEFLIYRVGLSLTTLAMYVLIAQHVTGAQADLTFWVIGNAFALCVFECIFGIGGTFDNERYFGRLRSIIVSPTSRLTVIMYKGLSSIIVAMITIIVSFVVGGFIFGVNFGDLNIAMFFLAILSAAFACVGLGLLFAIFALITDSIYMLLNTLSVALMIFSGANFPVAQLPLFAQWIAHVFPLFRSVQAANMSMNGSFDLTFIHLIIGEFGLGVIFYIIAVVLIKIIERVAIKNATLEVF